jgi:hypothetical protein
MTRPQDKVVVLVIVLVIVITVIFFCFALRICFPIVLFAAITLNLEISPQDPSGVTTPYKLLVPALHYDGTESRLM